MKKITLSLIVVFLFANAFAQESLPGKKIPLAKPVVTPLKKVKPTTDQTTEPLALPDLKISYLGYNITQQKFKHITYSGPNDFQLLTIGDIVHINWGINNEGQSASGRYRINIRMSQAPPETRNWQDIKTQIFPGLEPKEGRVYSQEIIITEESGWLNLSATLELLDKEDWDDSNNYTHREDKLQWYKRELERMLSPDFELKLSSPDNYKDIQRTVRLLVEVTNKGYADSPASKIKLDCKGKNSKHKDVPPLRPGQKFIHEFQHKWPTVGKKDCTARVNFDDKISEIGIHQNFDFIDVYITLP